MPTRLTSPLGQAVALTISTPDLNRSTAFYMALGFTSFTKPASSTSQLLSDGSLLLLLRKGPPVPYLSLTYFSTSLSHTISGLTQQDVAFASQPTSSDPLTPYTLHSPNHLPIHLMAADRAVTQPSGMTLLTFPPEDYSKPDRYPNPVCGIFGGLALPISDLDTALSFWQNLGFVLFAKTDDPYPWAILSDGLAVLAFHQTPAFTTPAITYFATDMKSKIHALCKKNLIRHPEANGKSNVSFITPDSQRFNLFQLGNL